MPVQAQRPSSNLEQAVLCERDLWLLWEGQRYPPEALTTRDGERLAVVYRGRAGAGRGPDFRDAVIAGPEGLLQGDVELHVRSSDFRRHGHQHDPAYDGLALHLVFWHDEDADTLLAGGRRVPVVGLADWVQARALEIQRWLAGPARWQEPCRSAAQRLGASVTGAALDRLGDLRFRELTSHWRRRLGAEEAEQLLWEGLLEALGYGGDREAFRELARRLPWRRLQGGLASLPAAGQAAAAWRLLTEAAGPALAAGQRRPALRPGNRPQRRLEGAARLAARFAAAGLLPALLAPLQGTAAEAPRRLIRLLTVRGLVGRGRALEMLANAVLPLAATLPGADLEEAAESVYRRLPLPARYGAVRHLHGALAGQVPVNARRQQGMLHLLKEYCTRGGCGRCPLS